MNKLTVYTAFSEHYRPMFEQYYLPTCPVSFDLRLFNDRFSHEVRQLLEGYSFMSPKAVSVRLSTEGCRLRLELMRQHWGELILFTGVDFQFFKDVTPELLAEAEGCNLLTVSDNGVRCPDFMLVRCNEVNVKVQEDLIKYMDTAPNDALLLWGMDIPGFKYLPNTYWTHAGNNSYPVPPDIRVHHANHVVGFDAKMKLLAEVRAKSTSMGLKALNSELNYAGFHDKYNQIISCGLEPCLVSSAGSAGAYGDLTALWELKQKKVGGTTLTGTL